MTDIYLLALRVSHGARFVTLDAGVPRVSVPQATHAAVDVISLDSLTRSAVADEDM